MTLTTPDRLANMIPTSALEVLDPRSHMFRDWRNVRKLPNLPIPLPSADLTIISLQMSVDHIIDAKNRKEHDIAFVDKEGKFKSDTLFDHIVNSDLPEEEVSVQRLGSEAQVVMGAGTVTTARTMDYLVTMLLLNGEARQRLEKELREPMKDFPASMPPVAELYQLPWLQACIKEALRISPGLTHRLPRVFPDVDLVYKDWVIPRGVRFHFSRLTQPARVPQARVSTITP